MDYNDLKNITTKIIRSEIAVYVFSKHDRPLTALRRVLNKNTEFGRMEMMKFCTALNITPTDYYQYKIKYKGYGRQMNVCLTGEQFLNIVEYTNSRYQSDYLLPEAKIVYVKNKEAEDAWRERQNKKEKET